MAEWRIRDPGTFPPAFHAALARAPGETVICSSFTERAAIAAQRDWRVFTYSLRNFPSHSLHHAAVSYSHRTKVSWSPQKKVFELKLTSRPKAWQDMQIEE